MRTFALAAVAALAAAGCLGIDRTFPDETPQVVRLHVNAYSDTTPGQPRDGIIEVSGLGEDGEERAFEAELRIVLDLQTYDEPEPRYERVDEWTRKVDAPDFSSPDVPHVRHVVPEAKFPETSTYRASVVARLSDGRELSASALFHHTKP